MGSVNDPFVLPSTEDSEEVLDALWLRPTAPSHWGAAVQTGRLHAFGADERPVVGGLEALPPGHLASARTTVPLRRAMIGVEVVVVFDGGDPRRPIIVGVIESCGASLDDTPAVTVQTDGQRLALTAEREIVLCCGDASITLTRAGRVVIKGRDILSRSSGYNRLKGAAIDIN